jgi:hypothetical protein
MGQVQSPHLSLSSSLYLPHSSLSPFANLVLAGAARTTAVAGGTLGTGTSENDCRGEQAGDGGTRAALATSTQAGTMERTVWMTTAPKAEASWL